MKRRTALKRLAAGAGSTFALVSTATAESYPEPENLDDVTPQYRVTKAGVEEIDSDESLDSEGDCTVYYCCNCPYDCYDGCECAAMC
ncbi:hypothetical protein [Halorussus caseinilyticus]|uniref:hypothetical protein n=1 Tax=Halorussus caseinilyticus TaxID=3034025 RepID=UPI0023E7EBBA|nr:hypothetical protein [Halorussus sp. DT72]